MTLSWNILIGNGISFFASVALLLILFGFIISFTVFTPAILISCLAAVIAWIYTFRHFKEVNR